MYAPVRFYCYVIAPGPLLAPCMVIGLSDTFTSVIAPTPHIGDTKWVFPKIGVPPNHEFYIIGFSIINHPFWGTPIFGNTQIDQQDHPAVIQCDGIQVPPTNDLLLSGALSGARASHAWSSTAGQDKLLHLMPRKPMAPE